MAYGFGAVSRGSSPRSTAFRDITSASASLLSVCLNQGAELAVKVAVEMHPHQGQHDRQTGVLLELRTLQLKSYKIRKQQKKIVKQQKK